MGGYVVKRLALAVPTLLGLSFLIFVLGAVSGDPAEVLASRSGPELDATSEQVASLRDELGLDKPFLVRYGDWLSNAIRGDLGESLYTHRSVTSQIRHAFPNTVILAVSAVAMMVLLAVPMGALGALFHRRWGDQWIRVLALLAASIPGFFLAYLLVDFFAVQLRWFPVSGLDGPKSVVLPALTLAAAPAAIASRLLRASLLDVLGEDYIRTARAKGLAALPVLLEHAVRNASLPVLTVLGGVFGRLLEGAVVVEVIFNWSGVGNLTYGAVLNYDYPIVVGTVLCGGVAFIILNLLVDLSYGAIDPRIRVGARG